jgi:predicted phosphatase
MDNQQIFNIVVSFAGFLAGWVLNNITKSLSRLEDRLEEFPQRYVAKDDYRRDIDDIKEMLGKIFDKLDSKVDK